MRKFLRCGHLFDGMSDDLKSDQTVLVEDGLIARVGPTAEVPPARAGYPVMDHSRGWVLPGLIDIQCRLTFVMMMAALSALAG